MCHIIVVNAEEMWQYTICVAGDKRWFSGTSSQVSVGSYIEKGATVHTWKRFLIVISKSNNHGEYDLSKEEGIPSELPFQSWFSCLLAFPTQQFTKLPKNP